MQASNQGLERQILESFQAMQVNTIASLRIRVWLIAAAAVGIVLLVGVTLLLMRRLVIVPLVRTKQYLLNIAEGDLTQEFDYQSNNELGEMANAMNTMGENLRRIVAEINDSVATLTSHSDGLNRNTVAWFKVHVTRQVRRPKRRRPLPSCRHPSTRSRAVAVALPNGSIGDGAGRVWP